MIAVWIPVTVVPTSLATVAIETFITELSSIIRNWPAQSVSRISPAAPAFARAPFIRAPYISGGPIPSPRWGEIGPPVLRQTVAAACSAWLSRAALAAFASASGVGSPTGRGSSTSLAMTRRWIWLVPS